MVALGIAVTGILADGVIAYVACGLAALATHLRRPSLGGARWTSVVVHLVRQPLHPHLAFPRTARSTLGPDPLAIALWVVLLAR